MAKELEKTPLKELLGDYKHDRSHRRWSVYPYDGKFKIFSGHEGLPPNQTKIVDAPEALRRVFSKIKGGYASVGSPSFSHEIPEANICFKDLKEKLNGSTNGLLNWLNK